MTTSFFDPESGMRFIQLDSEQEAAFRKWALDNHRPGDKIEAFWHPIVRDECRRIDGAPVAERERMRRMFGEFDSTEEIDKAMAESIYTRMSGPHNGALMLAMSYLSDAQEVLANGPFPPTPDRCETVRQYLNVAKYIISARMDRRPQ